MAEHNSGPMHDEDCLARTVKSSPCRCTRRGWLTESVPRHQARAEVLHQLTTWALEQHTFTQADVPALHGPFGSDEPKWVRDTLKVGASLVAETFMDMRRRGLSMLDEVKPLEEQREAAEKEAAKEAAENAPEGVEDEPAEQAPREPATEYAGDGGREHAEQAETLWPQHRGRDVVSVPTQGALL